MLFLRLLGKLLLVLGFVALAYDGTRMLATPADGLVLTSLLSHLNNYSPGTADNLGQFLQDNGAAYIWRNALRPLLSLPAALLLGGLGALAFLAGYRRPPAEILGDEA